MKRIYQHIKEYLPFIFLAAIAIAIASFTIGKEIYGHREENLLSFAIVNFSGYLFFLLMPVELAFIYYLKAGIDPISLNAIAISTALCAQLADYYIGRSFSTRVIDRLVGRNRYEKAKEEIRKYGNVVIFVFNLLPISSPVILLAAGMLKLNLKETLFYSLLGLLLKYSLISLFF